MSLMNFLGILLIAGAAGGATTAGTHNNDLGIAVVFGLLCIGYIANCCLNLIVAAIKAK